jgi:copper chaperone
MKTSEFKINGMSCMHCVKAVEIELSKIELEESHVEIGSAKVSYDENKVNETIIVDAINESGYKVIS